MRVASAVALFIAATDLSCSVLALRTSVTDCDSLSSTQAPSVRALASTAAIMNFIFIIELFLIIG